MTQHKRNESGDVRGRLRPLQPDEKVYYPDGPYRPPVIVREVDPPRTKAPWTLTDYVLLGMILATLILLCLPTK